MPGQKKLVARNLIALVLATPWLVFAVVRVFALDRGFPLVAAVAFTPPVIVSFLLPLVAALLLRAWWTAVGVLAVALVMASLVIPRMVTDEQPVARGKSFTVLTANTYWGRADADRLIALAKAYDPDVITLQEITPELWAELREELSGEYPFEAGDPLPGVEGLATMSKRRLTPLAGNGTELDARWPEMAVAGVPVALRNLHPGPPVSETSTPRWQGWLASIPPARGSSRLRVIAGDLNATFDHRAFRSVLDRGYVDVGASRGKGLIATWSSSRFTKLTLDHVLVPGNVAALDYDVYDLPGSDHNAVVAKLRLP